MNRFHWLAGWITVASVGACSDDGAVTSAGMTEGSTGTGTTGPSTTGSTGDSPTTGSPTTGGTSDGTGTTGTTGTTSPTTGVMTGTTGTTEASTGVMTTTGLMTSSTTMMAGECGDGSLDDGEACDDGNLEAGDGCDAGCEIEVEACDPDGVYAIQGGAVAYTCCSGLVDVKVDSFILSNDGASIASSPSNPIAMAGAATMCPVGGFMNSGMIAGGCTEVYSVEGDFVDADTWTGVYSLEFIGDDCSCFNGMFGTPCIGQEFPVTAMR